MRNPLKALASWILRKELRYYQYTAETQNQAIETVMEANQNLGQMIQMQRLQIDKLYAEIRGQVH